MQFTKNINGYRVTFPNKWTASVQWGPATYSSNYDAPIGTNEHLPHETAEIWAYKGSPQKQSFNDPVGHQTSENVRDYLQRVSEFKS